MYALNPGETQNAASVLLASGGAEAEAASGAALRAVPSGAFPGSDGSYEVFFGGSYRELWSENYTLSIAYEGRRSVTARFDGGIWRAEAGDEELCALLNSPDCPGLTKDYFQAAASVYAAARDCVDRGVPLERMGEHFRWPDSTLAAPELMRLLMDDCGFSLSAAYQTVARCCGDIRAIGVDVEQLYPLQPRTAHVLSVLRSCRDHTLAVFHDARKAAYRLPHGAVEEGALIRLSFRVLGGRIKQAALLLWGDSFRHEYPMEREGDSFTVTVPATMGPMALWYAFRVETPDSAQWLCPDESGYFGMLCGSEAGGFRLTVYKRGFETPAWFRRSVMYQIFPDRFAFSRDGTAEKGVAYHRALGQTPELHGSLEEPVRYQPRPFESAYSPDDFYGGTLKGIEEKLPYLKALGVGVIYLNPIVEARSNHRYDASDYRKVDPVLGSNEDFGRLCLKAGELGIRLILDGVYSHTGADSVYFNRHGSYPGKGACQGPESEYFDWYDFHRFPEEYRCWWGFQDLPEVDEGNPRWQDFIITGTDSIVKTWLRRGASGWRLDVADELPDTVLALIRRAAKEEKPDALILGEVWEDAVIKESYGGRRNYALGHSLDSVMNYPFRNAVLDFVHRRINAYGLRDFLISQQMNYPKPMYYSLMNLLGSHDVERLRTALATSTVIRGLSREEQLKLAVSQEALDGAIALEKLCAAVQFCIPGVPSVYYGDEQGMCGVCDPFNRLPFKEGCGELHDWYAALAALRNSAPALSTGMAEFMAPSEDILLILRYISQGKDAFGLAAENGAYLCVINRGEAAKFQADCTMAGRGRLCGSIAARSAEIIRL